MVTELSVRSGIDEMTFSLDGASQDVYVRYRQRGSFEKSTAMMRAAIDEKRRLGVDVPVINWRYILFNWNDNDREMARARRLAAEWGVDRLCWEITDHPSTPTRGGSRPAPRTTRRSATRSGTTTTSGTRSPARCRGRGSRSAALRQTRRCTRAGRDRPHRHARPQPVAAALPGHRHLRPPPRPARRAAGQADGAIVDRDWARAFLPHPVAGGDKADVAIDVPMPRNPAATRCASTWSAKGSTGSRPAGPSRPSASWSWALECMSLLRRLSLLTAVLVVTVSIAGAQGRPTDIAAEVDAVYSQADSLYRDLHRQPELSGHEYKTAATLAAGLKALGYEVTTGVGRTGIVGVLKNGAGPVVLLRTELDALPVEEKTGLDYASTARTKDDNGVDVGMMHACGHDLHMAAWIATARIMAGNRARWAGTLVLMGQPAEETLRGAQWMIDDGLLTRFPRPDYALAVHDDARYPAGLIGYRAGPVLSNSDTIRITIFGAGGHGARPETTVDPVVIAARTVLALQTIVSREVSPFDAAVITVGTIHAGTKANIIPAEARIELSVRSLTEKVRAHTS